MVCLTVAIESVVRPKCRAEPMFVVEYTVGRVREFEPFDCMIGIDPREGAWPFFLARPGSRIRWASTLDLMSLNEIMDAIIWDSPEMAEMGS